MSDLILLCGPSGAGKSYWAARNLAKKEVAYVSRDEIRFSLLKDNEEYFSHEKEVIKELYKRVNEALKMGKDTYVDQTSLTPSSRRKLLNNVTGFNKVYIIYFKVSLNKVISQNKERCGRRHVPEDQLIKMYNSFVVPTYAEGFDAIFCYRNGELYYISKEG